MFILVGLLGRWRMINQGLKPASEIPIHKYLGGF